MALTPGTRLGVYEIAAQIGEGGMGQVYRATDTRLRRQVAIKTLPPALAADADRLARFQREAEVLAALNHPHIAAIYGLEESPATGSGQAGITALVMELVEGDDLLQRIARGAIPLDDALPIAKQIAEALEAAHGHGIIHRDLKPANIKVRPDGTVKVLDFGLAKALVPDPKTSGPQDHRALAEATQSPTITTPAMTQAGMILGTAAYMSPEQARGKPVDNRADIWAFGAVLFEMLTGTRAFPGEDLTVTLARVVEREPDFDALPPSVPPRVVHALRLCLRKDPRQRVSDIRDVRLMLEGAFEMAAPHTNAPAVPAPRRRVAALSAAALLLAGIVGATTVTWVAMRPSAPAAPRVSRFALAPSGAAALTISGTYRDLAITPDGSHVIYVGDGGTRLFVRALDALEPVVVFTGAPRGPFVSPDGRWVGFLDGGASLKKVALTGGPAVTLTSMNRGGRGATWTPDDTIVVGSGAGKIGLIQIAATGGAVKVLTEPDAAKGEARHSWPEVLPGGRSVLFTIVSLTGGLDTAQVAVLDLQTGTQKVLVRGGSHAFYVPSGLGGYLIYAAAGTLRAVAFDLATLETHGTPVPVVGEVQMRNGGAVDAVVGDSTLAYVSGGDAAGTQRTLVWVDRQGRETPIAAPARSYVYPRLSPDGSRVAVEVRDQEWDIWLVNLASATLARFSFGPAADRVPVWTPDGQRIVWSSERDGRSNMYWQSADGSGPVERLIQSPNAHYATAVSPDGTRLVFREDTEWRDLMVMALDGAARPADPGRGQPPEPRRAQALVQTPFNKTSPDISPDGRWIAYESDESGQGEIYVRPFPDVNAGRWQVSTGGGTKPVWAKSGRELFFMVPARAGAAVMSAPIEHAMSFAAGTPTKVLEGPYLLGTTAEGDMSVRTYDVAPDGQRFLMVKEGGAGQTAAPASLVVVLNWAEELKRLVPAR